MKQSEPPALASWMLRHLVLGNQTEALEGDLLEEFHSRRSAGWYWRQVFGAILASFSNEVRADWVTIWTVFFSIIWAYSLYVFPFVGKPWPLIVLVEIGLLPKRIGFQNNFAWAFALRYMLPVLFQTVPPLIIYLVGALNLKFWALTRGICTAVLAMLVLQHLPGQAVLDYLVLHGMAYHWVQLWKGYKVLIQFLPLLAAMWAAQYRRERSHSSPLLAD